MIFIYYKGIKLHKTTNVIFNVKLNPFDLLKMNGRGVNWTRWWLHLQMHWFFFSLQRKEIWKRDDFFFNFHWNTASGRLPYWLWIFFISMASKKCSLLISLRIQNPEIMQTCLHVIKNCSHYPWISNNVKASSKWIFLSLSCVLLIFFFFSLVNALTASFHYLLTFCILFRSWTQH